MNADVNKINDIFRLLPEVIAAYLFGSRYKGRASKSSDIDIALLLDEKLVEPRPAMETDYSLIIEERAGFKNIDVKILNVSPLYFQNEVLKDSKVIFCRDEVRRIRYEARLMSEYLDFKPYLDYYNKRMHEHIKEGTYGLGLSVHK